MSYGIRDVAEWYMSLASRPEYVYQVFERRCEIALANLQRVRVLTGERSQVVFMTGTDFRMQTGSMVSPHLYRQLYTPHRQLNDWVHWGARRAVYAPNLAPALRALGDRLHATDTRRPFVWVVPSLGPKRQSR